MTELRLGVSKRGPDGREHLKQSEYLAVDRSGPGVSFCDFIMGRGGGKTTALVLQAVKTALVDMPGIPGMITEPVDARIWDSFLPAWENVVPREWWSVNYGTKTITMSNGTVIYLRSRNVDNPRRTVQARGPDLGWIIHDEAAIKFNQRTFNAFLPAVRNVNAPFLFVDTTTTPRLGPYESYVKGAGHTVIQGSAYDSPFLSKEGIDTMIAEMSPDEARQEMLGEFVAQEGRIWKAWSDEDWPKGNVYPWEPTEGAYTLWCDIGLNSSWLIVKHPTARQDGSALGGFLDVIVGEWHPDGTGEVDEMTKLIDSTYGRPSAVYIGADYTTRSIQSAETAQKLISNRWGDQLLIDTPTGDMASKAIQLAAIKRTMQNGKGRRLCLWSGCVNHTEGDPNRVRSFKTMIDSDTFPESHAATPTIWPKDHVNEHCRDAVAYGVACRHAPEYGKNTHL
ncbi:MAG: hypothetical protein GY851_09420 [bacterium]|nr:hypothetical protein [bacterium]